MKIIIIHIAIIFIVCVTSFNVFSNDINQNGKVNLDDAIIALKVVSDFQAVSVSKLINWRGAWTNKTEYFVYDSVHYKNSSYICKRKHNSNTLEDAVPTNIYLWDILAKGVEDSEQCNFDNQSVTEFNDVFSAGSGNIITIYERTKLNNIENGADKTDTENVSAAGAVMTENDPIYKLSPSSNITNENIQGWNDSFSWGNHAEEGYIKQGSEINSIGSYKINNETVLSVNKDKGITYLGLQENLSETLLPKNSTFVGFNAGNNTSGSSNSFIGYYAGYSNSIGYRNTYIGVAAGKVAKGHSNTYIGCTSGYYNESGVENVFIGYDAGANLKNGSSNIFIGTFSGERLTGGDNNIIIGKNAGDKGECSNKLIIGSSQQIDDSPIIYGDLLSKKVSINSTDTPYNFYVNGDAGGSTSWKSNSDKRLKENISTISNALDKTIKLRGVNFNWKNQSSETKQIGLIAQEVALIIPEIVDKNGEYYNVQYGPLTAILIEAIKEQQSQIEEMKKRVEAMEKMIKINLVNK